MASLLGAVLLNMISSYDWISLHMGGLHGGGWPPIWEARATVYMFRVSEALCGVLDTSESYIGDSQASLSGPVAFLPATSSLDDLVYYIRSDFVAFCRSDLVA